jgi:hypothetical protein
MAVITTTSYTTPPLAKNGSYDFDALDLAMRDGSDYHASRAHVARSVALTVDAPHPCTVLVQTGSSYHGPWSTVGELAAATATGRFVVEPARWARIRVENGGKAQGPVTVVAAWDEEHR